MAHKSNKKHLKHVRQHKLEQDQAVAGHAKPPGTKALSAALGVAQSHKVRLTSQAKAATAAAKAVTSAAKAKLADKAKAKADDGGKAEPKDGIVRAIAKAVTAKPRRMMAKAKARVRSVLGVA